MQKQQEVQRAMVVWLASQQRLSAMDLKEKEEQRMARVKEMYAASPMRPPSRKRSPSQETVKEAKMPRKRKKEKVASLPPPPWWPGWKTRVPWRQ
eukprot:5394058-Karenia_brevis.AAC.1